MTPPARILAVDDQPANLALVQRILSPAGFDLHEARSGAEALALAQERLPDLILLDMHLPDMHGLEVLRRLRDSGWGAGVKVVAMSALANPEDQRLWLSAGCAGVIEKPITVATFVQTINAFLSGSDGADRPAELPDLSGVELPRDRLGEILVAHGLTTAERLASAVQTQRSSGKRLGQILVEQGAVSEDDIAWALSSQLGYPYVYLTPEIIDESAAHGLPGEFLRERRVLPIFRFGEEMTLAMADPTDQATVDEVAGRTQLAVKRALALGSNIEAMLDRLFEGPRRPSSGEVSAEAQQLQFHLVQALQQEATEVHFDPSADGPARVRYRVWGDLVERAAQPPEVHAALLRHLRRITGAGEDAATTAGVSLKVREAEVFLRAAFLPTTAGPAATVALHTLRTEVPSLAPLGVPEKIVGLVRAALGGVTGVVAVGCADPFLRATVLHAVISGSHRGKVWTLETLPVYRRPSLNQTVVTTQEAAVHLRSAAAAGADLIAIDEVSRRDLLAAVAEVGAERLVLSGHPHDEPAGLLALIVEAAGAALTASTVRAVVGARPIRLLCPSCKEAAPPAEDAAGRRRGQTFGPRGCEACGFTGFRGRRLLTAVWAADPDARAMLRDGRAPLLYDRVALEAAAAFREQGLALVDDGLTSPAELARVIESVSWT